MWHYLHRVWRLWLIAAAATLCMGCAIPVNAESEQPVYRLCCADGPVFNGFEVKWR